MTFYAVTPHSVLTAVSQHQAVAIASSLTHLHDWTAVIGPNARGKPRVIACFCDLGVDEDDVKEAMDCFKRSSHAV